MMPRTVLIAAVVVAATLGQPPRRGVAQSPTPADTAFVDTVSKRTFDYFWQTTNPKNGLTPDRWPTKAFSSIAAVGFALTAYPIGVERGWASRDSARARVLATLRFFWRAPQGPQGDHVTGYKGFYYHFLDMETGYRFQNVELSTIDTALLLAGALTCRQYFTRDDAAEREIRALVDSIYDRVDWQWARDGGTLVRMGWRPEFADNANAHRFIVSTWAGFNEGMILYILALGSPTHPLPPAAWTQWTKTYEWGRFQGIRFVQFAPLFGHQYSHVWIDFRGVRDAYMRDKGIDYFENSRRATVAQRAYAMANPFEWRSYSGDVWGLTASDGPLDSTFVVDGRKREFHTYWARGAAADDIRDDGTIAPTAAGGSIAFAPEIAIPALKAMRATYGDSLFGQFGFRDAFNPTLHWFDRYYLGIDEGPILAMAENWRSGFVWRLMRRDPAIVRGMCRAGFRAEPGGWLAGRC